MAEPARAAPEEPLVEPGDLMAAIENHPADAADALKALQPGLRAPVTLLALAPVAEARGQSLSLATYQFLLNRGWVHRFAQAMRARGVPLGQAPLEEVKGRYLPEEFRNFLSRAEAFRCRILVGGEVRGSGCLVGPSLVLTAWHVIASGDPPYHAADNISVMLSDHQVRKVLEPPVYVSDISPQEFAGQLLATDADYDNRHDTVLLRLAQADGARLGYATLPEAPPALRGGTLLHVLDFPHGLEKGTAYGQTRSRKGLTVRVMHTAETEQGSSGAGCVDQQARFVGIHQGRWPPNRRLVPISLFLDDISTKIKDDIAPPSIWSLNGRQAEELVLGRSGFIAAVAEASRRVSRARGVRVRRRNPLEQGTIGLNFSFRLLQRMLALQPGLHRALHCGFEQRAVSLFETIRTAAAAQELDVPVPEAGAGVRAGETTPEAALNDEAQHLATALNVAAGDKLLWIFIEHPPVGLPEPDRFALEAFTGAALLQPNLRIVVAGFETMTLPGEEFGEPGQAAMASAPGLIVENIGWVTRRDIADFLVMAGHDLKKDMQGALLDYLVGRAVRGLKPFNDNFGYYDPTEIQAVARNLAEILETLA